MSDPWRIDAHGRLHRPGCTVLACHDDYFCGKQAGVEIVHHGRRTLTCGGLQLSPAPADTAPQPAVLGRRAEGRSVVVDLRYRSRHGVAPLVRAPDDGFSLAHRLELAPAGEGLSLDCRLEEPLPADLRGAACLLLGLMPNEFWGRSYVADGAGGVFPRVWEACPGPVLACGRRLSIAPEDPERAFTVETEAGEIELASLGAAGVGALFVLRQALPDAAAGTRIRWTLTPRCLPGWRAAPRIQVPATGFDAAEEIVAVLEMDGADEADCAVWLDRDLTVERADTGGGFVSVRELRPAWWGRWLDGAYALATIGRLEPGLYRLRWAGAESPPLTVETGRYGRGVWQPTLSTFLPVQMCHVTVRDRNRVWHGACHGDDARQAPTRHEHFDGYRQSERTETPYAPGEAIPGLAVGGWHDAGDYDLATGSQARTAWTLAVAAECFAPDLDRCTVREDEALVLLGVPDGLPDVLEQLRHGCRWLLATRATCGHAIQGVVAATLEQYVHYGDASTMCGGGVPPPADDALPAASPSEAPLRIRQDRSRDWYTQARWAFTDRNRALEFLSARALAAAARVLGSVDAALAAECLRAARDAFDQGRAMGDDGVRGAYCPRDPRAEAFAAAVELAVTTGDDPYRQAILDDLGHARELPGAHLAPLARAVDLLPADERAATTTALRAWLDEHARCCAACPYGVAWRESTWGQTWGMLGRTVDLWFLRAALGPEAVPAAMLTAALHWALGRHPGEPVGVISGVGARSLLAAYGANRMDHAFIPGGVSSGPSLIGPGRLELVEDFPFLWQQAEYVIHGASTFVFAALAADTLLAGDG